MTTMTTEFWIVCIIAVAAVIIVVVPCLTYLIRMEKIGHVKWEKGKLFKFEPPDNGNEAALMFIDKSHDKAEYDFKDKMIDVSYESFKDNILGQKYATRIVALNHCMKDMYDVGFDNYIANLQLIGKWTDTETQSFVRGLLTSSRKMVNAKLDAYEKSMQLRSSDTFRKITQGKIEKNLRYSKMINDGLESIGIGCSSIEEAHALRSGMLMKNQPEQAT